MSLKHVVSFRSSNQPACPKHVQFPFSFPFNQPTFCLQNGLLALACTKAWPRYRRRGPSPADLRWRAARLRTAWRKRRSNAFELRASMGAREGEIGTPFQVMSCASLLRKEINLHSQGGLI